MSTSSPARSTDDPLERIVRHRRPAPSFAAGPGRRRSGLRRRRRPASPPPHPARRQRHREQGADRSADSSDPLRPTMHSLSIMVVIRGSMRRLRTGRSRRAGWRPVARNAPIRSATSSVSASPLAAVAARGSPAPELVVSRCHGRVISTQPRLTASNRRRPHGPGVGLFERDQVREMRQPHARLHLAGVVVLLLEDGRIDVRWQL